MDRSRECLLERGVDITSSLIDLGLAKSVTREGRGQGLEHISGFYHWFHSLGEPVTDKQMKEIAEFNKIPEKDVDAFVAKVDAQKRKWAAQAFNIQETEVDSLVRKVNGLLGDEYIKLNAELYS